MNIFKKLMSKYNNLKFKIKLIITYLPLILLSTVLIGYLNYSISSNIILQNARDSLYNLVVTSNEILDSKFSTIIKNIKVLHSDKDLYEYFSNANPQNSYNIVQNQKKISNIIIRYFPYDDFLYSANIISSYFTFGKDIMSRIPEKGLQESFIPKEAKQGMENMTWLPTYDFLELFDPKLRNVIELDYRYIFSIVKEVNLFDPDFNIYLNENIEKPVIAINLREDLYSHTLKGCLSVEDSYYYVITQDKRIVSHLDKNKLHQYADFSNIDAVLGLKTGVTSIETGNEKVLVCFDTSEITNWTTVVFIPYSKLLKTLPDIKAYTVIITIILSSIFVFLSILFSARITLPIKRILIAIRNIGEGKFLTSTQTSSQDEFGILENKLRQMDLKIHNLIEENYKVTIREKESEIMALTLQMNPHFIGNTLNIVNWLAINRGNDDISDIIVTLCDMLNYSIREKSEEAQLKEEIEYVEKYVYIMKKWFENRFEIEYHIQPEVYDVLVPKLFLQPYVENAIIHGFDTMKSGGLIAISAWIQNNICYFSIKDNGKGISKQHLQKIKNEEYDRIGVKNLNKRIKLLYGNTYGVDIQSEENIGTEFIITIPLFKDKLE